MSNIFMGGQQNHASRIMEACKQQNYGSMQAAELWKHACKQQNYGSMQAAEVWKHGSSRTMEACKQKNYGSMQAAEVWKHGSSRTMEACKQKNYGSMQAAELKHASSRTVKLAQCIDTHFHCLHCKSAAHTACTIRTKTNFMAGYSRTWLIQESVGNKLPGQKDGDMNWHPTLLTRADGYPKFACLLQIISMYYVHKINKNYLSQSS